MARRPTRRLALTHFDARGRAHMVDVGAKAQTHRVAVASGRILMRPATLRAVAAGRAKKGDVLGVARIAAIQAAKRTPELIPLAHPIAITRAAVEFALDAAPQRGAHRGARWNAAAAPASRWRRWPPPRSGCSRSTTCSRPWTAAWCSTDLRLEEKRGGRSGTWRRPAGRG